MMLIVQSITLKQEGKVCESDSDCELNQTCVYEEQCDNNGCSKSETKTCKDVELSKPQITKSQIIEKYLSDTFINTDSH